MLDIGGGTGLLTETLLDVFDQMVVSGARPQKGGVRGEADGKKSGSSVERAGIPIAGGSIGTLVSVAAFHHFPDQDAALEEMGRVLKPRGSYCWWR